MAARKLQIKLPGPPFPWWELFDCNVDDILTLFYIKYIIMIWFTVYIDEICIAVASLYRREKATYINVKDIPAPNSSTPNVCFSLFKLL